MIFTNDELSAILRMATAMAGADGNVSDEEKNMLILELLRFGVTPEKAKLITKRATDMTPTEACILISKMTNEEKKYVTAYLGTMICADGKIEESEIKMWKVISALCGLPEMDIETAIKVMADL